MSITLQLAARLTLTWATRGSRARAAASIFWHSATFSANGTRLKRIVGAVHRLVGARRRRHGFALAEIEQLQGRRGALDRRLADLVGVGEGGGLAGHAAQAEARGGVIIGGLQPAVVEAERLARAILKVQLAVVAAGEMLRGEPPRAIGIEAAVEKAPGIGRGHAAWLSAGPPMRTKRRSQ